MKFAIGLFSTLIFAPTAFSAGPLTCADLEAAYKADQITEVDFDCNGNAACEKLWAEQLRITAKEKGGFEDPATSNEDMKDQFEPIYTKLYIGSLVLDGVNVSLGENPVVSYFEAGTTTLNPLTSDDGSLAVGSNYCDVELAPYMSDVRKKNVCELVVAELKVTNPGTLLTVAACMDEDASFYIESQTKTSAEISVARNMNDLGGGYFSCTAGLDRTNDKVSNVDCN